MSDTCFHFHNHTQSCQQVSEHCFLLRLQTESSQETIFQETISHKNRLYSHTYLNNTRLPIIDHGPNQITLLSNKAVICPSVIPLYPLKKIPHADILLTDFYGLLIASYWLRQKTFTWNKKHALLISEYATNELFKPQPSSILTSQLPPHVTAAIPLWEDLGFVSRLCHPEHPGCFSGTPIDLLHHFDFSENTPCRNILILTQQPHWYQTALSSMKNKSTHVEVNYIPTILENTDSLNQNLPMT